MTNSQSYHLLKTSGFEFSSHDIRRTVATKLYGMPGISETDVDLILDHAVSGVNQSYITKTPLSRKRLVISKWHSYLSELMNPEIAHLKRKKEIS